MTTTADTRTDSAILRQFHWTPQPQAERLVVDLLRDFLGRNPWADQLARRMRAETGTRFPDWIDHLSCPASDNLARQLESAGFTASPAPGAARRYVQPGGIFPAVLLSDERVTRAAIKVESVPDFLAAHNLSLPIQGSPLSPYRRSRISSADETELWAVERHGYRGYDLPAWTDAKRVLMVHHLEAFRLRPRDFADDAEGFDVAESLLRACVADLGRDTACDLFFAAEREYWQRRNRAARVQKARQDRLGLGWANHDHHTYRSSRKHFARLIGLWEMLGFELRERFYAGAEAGWGAQVCEQPVAGFVTFNDVDLSPEELLADFSHEPLPERNYLGTVGLWCELHGEAFLQAGMHHLECQFDFDALKQQLEGDCNVKVMNPFTNFPYLRQAFTEGERWPVREDRIQKLLAAGLITPAQAEQFRHNGALGSHLENLERNQGFKGFNQKGVSDIIARTDPRLHSRSPR